MSAALRSWTSSSTLSAQELHDSALGAHRFENRGRLTLIQVLRILEESGQYQQLGFPSIAAYADKTFGFGRSETYRYVRVAKALDHLPQCLEAFGNGKLSWSALREIARVASEESEEEWLELEKSHTASYLKAEVRAARNTKRDTPRKDGYGQAAIMHKLQMNLTVSEFEKVRGVLKRIGKEAAEALGGETLPMKEAFMYLIERLLAPGHELDETLAQGRTAEYALVYQACPSCERAGVHTQEGLVEVERKELERVVSEAEIDQPTPAWMVKQVHRRDGERCSNPYCSHPSDQAHHVVFRAQGGRTNPESLTSVCCRCHVLIHASLLEVSGTAPGALIWTPLSATLDPKPPALTPIVADALPVFRVECLAAHSPEESPHAEKVRSVLRNQKFRKAEVDEKLRTALEVLDGRPHSFDDLLLTALSGRLRQT